MIAKLTLLTPAVTVYRPTDFAVFLSPAARYDNPYDYDQINLVGIFQSPDGRHFVRSAFFYQDYKPTGKNPEKLITRGPAHFRFRFAPDMPGTWNLSVQSPQNSNQARLRFYVRPENRVNRGIITVDRLNNRFFVDGAGKTFLPVGCNLAWPGRRHAFADYKRWFSQFAVNKMNITRIWLAPWSFALHRENYADFKAAAERLYWLDQIIETAGRQSIYIILTLLNHGQFSTKINPTWLQNPWNSACGGPLKRPIDFFLDKKARLLYRNQLRYIVARYGYADQIFAWELCNEIDHIDDYHLCSDEVTAWQQEAAAFIKSTDDNRHMVTTSYINEYGPAFKLTEIDFVSAHSYDYRDADIETAAPAKIADIYRQYQKPVLYAEFGISFQSGTETYKLDPQGRTVTAGLWANLFGGAAGAAMPWWWDSYIEKYDLFHLFGGAGRLALRFDFSDKSCLPFSGQCHYPGIKIYGYRFTNRLYGIINGDFSGGITDARIVLPLIASEVKPKIFKAADGSVYSDYQTAENDNTLTVIFGRLAEALVIIIA